MPKAGDKSCSRVNTNSSGVSSGGDISVLNCGDGYKTVKIPKTIELYILMGKLYGMWILSQ